jgi:hypothetical protein
MFRRLFSVAVLMWLASTTTPQAHCDECLKASSEASVAQDPEKARPNNALLDEILVWLSTNFDLPAITDRPAIEFVPKPTLAMIRAEERAPSEAFTYDANANRQVVALYDSRMKTIFLPDDWTGTSTANQSVLVHEMVHHIQTVANLKFECPMAREKVAYFAQDKWLQRFGMSLEKEFEVDMFTIVISSACVY